MKLGTAGFVAAAALMAGPVLAEKAYVPVSDGAVGRGVTHRTEISVSNAKGAAESRLSVRFGGAAAQEVSLKGGESRKLDRLNGNGLAELDLAKGVEASATLFVERPGRDAARVWIPVLTGVDTLSPAPARCFTASDWWVTSTGPRSVSST